MITPHDMTVYNAYVSAGSTLYQRTQVTGVKWENRKASNVIKSGLLAADSVVVYVPFERGTNYLKPKAWTVLTSKTGKWTLKEGDYLVRGLVTDEISGGFTITALKAKYDDVVSIKSVDTMDAGSTIMHHWQVGGS
jgi:hypothetical protein